MPGIVPDTEPSPNKTKSVPSWNLYSSAGDYKWMLISGTDDRQVLWRKIK